MVDDRLEQACALAEKICFSSDTLRGESDGAANQTDRLRSYFAQSDLLICDAVAPSVSIGLRRVYERLRIPPEAVQAFVYASPNIQAECFANSTKACVVRFSSAIIDLLDEDEIEFVAGHELGHFLLGHGLMDHRHREPSLEFYMQLRSQEISADRTGLIACRSLDVAVRALMKTTSGLSSRHLRFDVGTFLSQLRHVDLQSGFERTIASHPSVVVRCRALLWFSLGDLFKMGERFYSLEQMKRLDAMVQKDLAKYVDGPARQRIANAKENVALWMAAYEVVQDGVFAKREQEIFESLFGQPTLQLLKNFLRDTDASKINDEVFARMKTARDELEAIIPISFESEIEKIQDQISKVFVG
jgi:hypothetical protein